MKTIIGVLRNPVLMKDIFSGLGYFMLAGGVAKIFVYAGAEFGVLVKFIISVFILVLGLLALLFWMIHVVRPIIKISWPEFGVPNIDEGVGSIPFRRLLVRLDVWVYVGAGVLSSLVGWSVIMWLVIPR